MERKRDSNRRYKNNRYNNKRPKYKRPCRNWQKNGSCPYGDRCKWASTHVGGAKPCTYFMRTGSCKFGDQCKFSHDQSVISAAKRQRTDTQAYGGQCIPVPKKRGVCRFFAQSGFCKFGDGCRFSHDVPNTAKKSQRWKKEKS